MSTKPKNTPAKGGLSSFANLLDPSSNNDSSTISRAPVVFQQTEDVSAQEEAAAKKQINAAALRFQPSRRPQVGAQKNKTKVSAFSRPIPPTATSNSATLDTVENSNAEAISTAQPPAPSAAKSTLADWAASNDDDVNGFYENKRQRGGRKKRKKANKEEAVQVQDWDDIYDPSRPNNYEEYVNSEEKRREIRDWKEKLYSHRRARRRDSELSDRSDDEERGRRRPAQAFAPPANYSFAPPPINETPAEATDPEAGNAPNDATGEDAYLRRLRLSHTAPQPDPINPTLPDPAHPPEIEASPPPPPPPQPAFISPQETQPQIPMPPAPPPLPPQPAAAPPTATISRAPVRYNLPAAPAEIQVSQDDLDASLARDNRTFAEDDEPTNNSSSEQVSQEQQQQQQPRSNRPGQQGFAARYMASQGWKKGEGLGASGSGIINPLRVQVEKRKQRSDAEGGGFIGPGGKGKIVGGAKSKKKKKKANDGGEGAEEADDGDDDAENGGHGKFGPMSEVVVARGMLVGMDVDAEIANGLLQELGEECESKYGRLVRVFINRESAEESPPVFFHFTTALSALRAVNALDGRIFNGNTITAKFFDADKFEKGDYV